MGFCLRFGGPRPGRPVVASPLPGSHGCTAKAQGKAVACAKRRLIAASQKCMSSAGELRMLSFYGLSEKGLETLSAAESGEVPPQAGWVDLFQPTPDEDHAVEAFLGAQPPDPRRGPGDRVFQPLLRRGRRHLHDRDGADRRRHRQAGAGAVHHRRRRRAHRHAALRRPAGACASSWRAPPSRATAAPPRRRCSSA